MEIRLEESVKIGDTEVRILFYEKEGPLHIVYIHLHGDEPGARDTAIQMVNRYGGRVISFLHGNERYISFTLDGVEYAFDPNRMFSAQGIEASLRREDKYCSLTNYSHQAREHVVAFAQHVLVHLIGGADIIIAPHNNSDGDYHASLYLEGEKFADDAEHVHIHDDIHHSDFFFTISREHHEELIVHGFNSVLQSENATEDGSLSMFCATHGRIYLNCEADEEHLDYQLTMLRGAYRMFIKSFASHIKSDDLTTHQRESLLSRDVQAGKLESDEHEAWEELEVLGLAYIWHRADGRRFYTRTVAGDLLYKELVKEAQ